MTYPSADLYLGRVDKGATLPVFMEVGGVGRCAVKFCNNPQGLKALINEFLGFHVAALLGIDHPPFGIAEVPEDALPHDGKLLLREEYKWFGQTKVEEYVFEPGLVFYSKWLQPSNELKPEDLQKLMHIHNAGDLAAVVVLDVLLGNWDRKPLNPNLIVVRENGSRKLKLIDLGMCFGSALWDQHSLSNRDIPPLDEPLPYAGDMGVFFENITALTDFQPAIAKLDELNAQWLTNLLGTLPPSWQLNELEAQALVTYVCHRAEHLAQHLENRFARAGKKWWQ